MRAVYFKSVLRTSRAFRNCHEPARNPHVTSRKNASETAIESRGMRLSPRRAPSLHGDLPSAASALRNCRRSERDSPLGHEMLTVNVPCGPSSLVTSEHIESCRGDSAACASPQIRLSTTIEHSATIQVHMRHCLERMCRRSVIRSSSQNRRYSGVGWPGEVACMRPLGR